MGFLDFLKSDKDGSKEEPKNIPWQLLSQMEQLDEIAEISKTMPVAIFKHSTRCGISKMVLRQFERSYAIEEGKLKLYFLNLLEFRDISNEVSIRFQILHQSPQLIVIRDGVAIAHASHHGIQAHQLEEFV